MTLGEALVLWGSVIGCGCVLVILVRARVDHIMKKRDKSD